MNTKILDALLKQFTTMERGPAGCALSVSLEGKCVYEGFSGYADVESGRKIDADTLYRLYSSTKVVTAVAMMILLERGLYQLDDPIARYLPEFEGAKYSVRAGNNTEAFLPATSLTVKHFLTMTSGLTYDGDSGSTHMRIRKMMEGINAEGGCSTREFSRRTAEIPLAFEPGAHWNYGINLDVLGAFIEVVGKKSFGDFLKDEFFAPLQMHSTCFFPDSEASRQLATLYRRDERNALIPNPSEDFKFRSDYQFECGGGGLVSSLGDMTKFAQMLSLGGTLGGARILGRKSIELMRQNHLSGNALEDFRRTHQCGWPFMSGYGYGLGVKVLMNLAESNCAGTPGEFSWAGATGTLTLVDPIEKLSIVYMQQLMPDNQEGYCHPRLRNAVYGILD